jgi:stage II sporulation protein D
VRRAAAVIAFALVCAPPAAAALSSRVVIDGRGWGHGVGMSQWGARGFALHGWDYRRILAHYYPGTTLDREAGVTVRVLVAEGRRVVTIGSKAPFRVRDARGRVRVVRAGRRRVATDRVRLTFLPGAQPLSLDAAGYRGELVVGGGNVVNVLPLERYLRGVVPWEMPRRWAREALKAQAVAARSYALATLERGRAFDLYADTRDQVYGGIRAESDATNRAIGATAGQVLTWDGQPALTYYFSTSGGRTAAAGDSLPWAPRVPYLVSVPDPYDALSPHHSWSYSFARARLAALLHLPGLRRIELRRAPSGRVAEVVARWRGGARTIAGRTFQHELGLPSTWFSIGGAKTTMRRHPPTSTSTSAYTTGWIVVLASDPSGASARAHARELGAKVLRSDDYPSLNPGYWVVYRGPYATRAAAANAATGGAYVRRLTPG